MLNPLYEKRGERVDYAFHRGQERRETYLSGRREEGRAIISSSRKKNRGHSHIFLGASRP